VICQKAAGPVAYLRVTADITAECLDKREWLIKRNRKYRSLFTVDHFLDPRVVDEFALAAGRTPVLGIRKSAWQLLREKRKQEAREFASDMQENPEFWKG
jgi:hypothetical protein